MAANLNQRRALNLADPSVASATSRSTPTTAIRTTTACCSTRGSIWVSYVNLNANYTLSKCEGSRV